MHVQRDSVPVQQVILEVRVGDIASSTISALRVGDRLRLPVEPVLALAELRNTLGAVYVSSDSLAITLHASIAVDWDELVVTISDDGTLPVSRRLARARFRERLDDRRQTSTQDGLIPDAQILRTSILPDDIIVDYDVSSSSRSQLSGSSVRLAIGTNLMGGVLNVDWAAARAYRHASPTVSWDGIPTRSSFRSVHLGMLSFAQGMIIGNGVSVSNALPLRMDSVGSVILGGTVGRGWDFETYRDALLIDAGVADSAGSYTQSIPLLRGINRLTINSYGPDGDQHVINRYISINDDIIPAGTAIYRASLGRCATATCDFAGELTTQYSPFQRLTTSVGVTGMARAGHYSLLPSAQFATHIRDDINATVQANGSGKNADLRFAPSPEFELQVSYHTLTNDVDPNTHGGHWSSAIMNAQLNLAQTGCSLGMDAELLGLHLGDEQRLRLFSSAVIRGAYIRPFVSVTRTAYSRATDVGGFADLSISPLLPPGSRLSIGTSGIRSGDGFTSVEIPVSTLGRVGFGVEWGSGVRPRATMSLSITSASARYESRGSAQGRSVATTNTLSGSAQLSLRSRTARVSALQSRGRARVEGTVFLDENSNGLLDPVDHRLPGVVVMIGSLSVETDSTGTYTAEDAVPFQSVIVSADPLALPSTEMRSRAVRVVPLPDTVTRVDVPVSITR